MASSRRSDGSGMSEDDADTAENPAIKVRGSHPLKCRSIPRIARWTLRQRCEHLPPGSSKPRTTSPRTIPARSAFPRSLSPNTVAAFSRQTGLVSPSTRHGSNRSYTSCIRPSSAPDNPSKAAPCSSARAITRSYILQLRIYETHVVPDSRHFCGAGPYCSRLS